MRGANLNWKQLILLHQALELTGNISGAPFYLHLLLLIVPLQLPWVTLVLHELSLVLVSNLHNYLLLLEQALCQVIDSEQISDDLELFGPLLNHNLEGLVLLIILNFILLYLFELNLNLSHPFQMFQVHLKVLLSLLLLVLEQICLQIHLVLPACPLSLDDKAVVCIHALDS